jgi:predicted nuclease with TOPRIM domain
MNMMGLIGLIISVIVAGLQVLRYVHDRNLQKENNLDKFVKADDLEEELKLVTDNIKTLFSKLDKLNDKISEIQLQNAICSTERENIAEDIEQQIKLLEKLNDKLDTLK